MVAICGDFLRNPGDTIHRVVVYPAVDPRDELRQRFGLENRDSSLDVLLFVFAKCGQVVRGDVVWAVV